MAASLQPAKKSYFFDKGYRDLGNTIRDAWRSNGHSMEEYIGKIGNEIQSLPLSEHRFLTVCKIVMNILALLSVLVFGSLITAAVSIVNIAVLLVIMAGIYLVFSVVWLADRIYLMRNRIFTACPECKEKSLIPTYICPKCGAKHTNLTPGVYGIFHRTCTGSIDGQVCGEILPTTFWGGRGKLAAVCPHCDAPLSGQESVPLCIPVVGGRSVGKTAFITAFAKEFIDSLAPEKGWEVAIYDEKKRELYREIEADYLSGKTRMTERPTDSSSASSVPFSFFVRGKEFVHERLVHVYDIAGEVFTDSSENEVQKQYEYCQGMVLVIDPFAIPSVRFRLEEWLTPQDIAGIGKADINGILDSFLNKLREVTGLTERKMSSVPLAVVIGKMDSAGLSGDMGDVAVRRLMKEKPEVFGDYYDTMDYLCRKFLADNGMGSFVNAVSLRFKTNRFFACSAIGHTRDRGKYRPQGVMAPMQWLFDQADPDMARAWNDIKFSKQIPIQYEEKG